MKKNRKKAVLCNRSSSRGARLHKVGPARKIVESRHASDGVHAVTYQRELRQCGKPRCLRWHGPYWYAHWKSDGRKLTRYIGKKFRELSRARS